MVKDGWVYCPVCHNKTRTKIRPDTVAKNLPVFCPKCKNVSVMNFFNGKEANVKENRIEEFYKACRFACEEEVRDTLFGILEAIELAGLNIEMIYGNPIIETEINPSDDPMLVKYSAKIPKPKFIIKDNN